MNEKAKSVTLAFFFGIAAGLLVFAAVMRFVVIPTDTARADAFKKASQDAAQHCSEELDKQRKMDADMAADFIFKNKTAGFTALVEPGSQQPSPLQLFDVLRPGLGTMLAKLQNAQPQNVAVKWVVPGHVKPASNSPGYSYCWLNANGEADPQNCPAITNPAGVAQ